MLNAPQHNKVETNETTKPAIANPFLGSVELLFTTTVVFCC